jgi:hypothetical protein|nr:MAG TPA: replisome organizer protein [Caudoviricetes sp.]
MRYYESEAAALRGLKPSSKVLALVLAARMNDTHDNWPGRPVCFPSLDALAEDTDLGKRMVRYAIAELIEAKVIRVYKDREPGARWDHNVYEWTAPISPNYRPDWMKRPDKQKSAIGARLTNEGWEYCEENHVGPHTAAADHPEFVLPAEQPVLVDDLGATDVAEMSAAETPVEEKEAGTLPIDVTPPKKPAREATGKPADGFDDWWKQYPKKVGKIDAQKAYRAAIKQGAKPQDLLDGLRRHNANWKAANTERQYIPNPASWLRKGRWEDELEAPDSGQAAPAINPATGKEATKEDFWYACIDHGIDPNGIINFWKPSMDLPGDPGWPEVEAYLYRQVGRA